MVVYTAITLSVDKKLIIIAGQDQSQLTNGFNKIDGLQKIK